MTPIQYKVLSAEQIDHFIEHGYVVIKSAFSKQLAEEWTKTIWIRLGMDPSDKSTWTKERVHMPFHQRFDVKCFSPKAWGAITELLGGEDRVDKERSTWSDSFIVNLGLLEYEGKAEDPIAEDPRKLDNWHVDGDFFVHYLDSPEQALLVIPIYADIKPRGGGTFVSPDGLDKIANYLAKHPEGVLPVGLSLTPSTTKYDPEEYHKDPGYWSHLEEIQQCNKFAEMTGDVGDVILLHPLMMHSASKNWTRIPRIITNPPVCLKEPFNFSRADPDDYNIVERKTLKALGVKNFDFAPSTERRRIVPARVAGQEKLLQEEKRRLAAAVDVTAA